MNFEGSPLFLKPIEEFVDPSKYWQIRTKNLNPKNTDDIIIINVPHYKDDLVKENLGELNLRNLPILIFDYHNLETGRRVDRQSIATNDDIYIACRALERYITEQKKFRILSRIHLFGRAPAAMMALLGMHFCLKNLMVTLYEYGKKAPVEEEPYYYVISCE